MANRAPLEIVTGVSTPPLSATDPPLPPPSGSTRSEPPSRFLRYKPFWYAGFTIFVINLIQLLLLLFSNQVTFSVKSISVSPSSSATWHIDFVVKNPSSLYNPIYYDGSDVYVKLGYLNTAVLNTSSTHGSLGWYTRFSVDLAMEGNQTDVVAASPRVLDLNMKVSAKKKPFGLGHYEYGYIDIKCPNLTLGHLNIHCHSSFKDPNI